MTIPQNIVRWVTAIVLVVGFSMAGSCDDADAAVNIPRLAPPCIHEDGSGQRACVWLATQRGNGEGQSFVMQQMDDLPAVYTYVSNRRARKVLNRWKRRYCSPVSTSANPADRVCTHWQIIR
jgi:hypothetical protein